MQDQKLASLVVASLQGEEQPAAAVLRLSHQVQAGSVFQSDKVNWQCNAIWVTNTHFSDFCPKDVKHCVHRQMVGNNNKDSSC